MNEQPKAPPGDAQPIFQQLDRTARYPYSKWFYVRRILWTLTYVLLVRPTPNRMIRWRYHLYRLFGAKLGPRVNIQPRTRVWHPWQLEIGDCSALANDVVIYNLGPVCIGEHTVLSQGVYVCAGTHDHTKPNLPLQRPPIQIGSGVWICAQAFIGPGVTVGDNAVVGARAVAMRDVPTGMIVAGNPAQVVAARRMDEGLDTPQ